MNRLILMITLVFPIAGYSYEPINWASGWNWGAGTARGVYNPATVETLEGSIHDIGYFERDKGIGRGIFLILDTGDEKIPVALAPDWYMENKKIELEKGDHIKVTGSRVNYQDLLVIIAAELVIGNQTYQLRDSEGAPDWSGWRQDDNWFNRGWRGAK